MTRAELIQKLTSAKQELKSAGPIHRRNLQKHIHRLEKELRTYDYYRAAAQKSSLST